MFSVKLNGSLCGYFQGQQGIRQFDPLSPYLFVIAMEGLALSIEKEFTNSDFKLCWRTKPRKLTHLCFADDLSLFCHGDYTSTEILNNSLTSYSNLSGLAINHSKSQCFLANSPQNHSDRILSCLNISL